MEANNFKEIVSYLNRGIIENSIEYAKKNDSFVCIAKVGLKINLKDAYTYKDLLGFLHVKSDYGPVLINQEDAVILIFRDYKVHQAKAAIQKIQRFVSHIYNVELKHVGLTLIDSQDDIKNLITRLEKQYRLSKLSKQPKICYDTKHFDFQTSTMVELGRLFKKHNIIKIHNLYEGVPVVDRVCVQRFKNNNILVKIEKNRIPFFMRESFCFIEHDLLPSIIKANIATVNQTFNSLTLSDLELVESSPVERSGIRVQPHKKIHASLLYENKDICRGFITNISENSVALALNKVQIKQLNQINLNKKYLNLRFQIPTKKSYITTIKTKATIFRTDSNVTIFSIFPSPVAKKKIRSYVSMQQASLLMDLKIKLKETYEFIK